ncbi:MAG: ABC transporter substrate-binding protein [Burkholderiaceae bacterium]
MNDRNASANPQRRALIGSALTATTMSLAGFPRIAAAKDKLSLLYLPVTDYAPFFVAKEKGYFDAYGLDLDLLPKDATAETVPLVASGRVTLGGASWAAGVFNAAAAGSGVTAVAGFARVPARGRSSVHFMVSPALAAKGLGSPKDLKGKRIGVLGAGAFTVYFAAQALQSGGVALNDVQIVHLTMSTLGQAFANGSIDAGVVFEPFATLFEDKNIARIVPGEFARGVDIGFILVNSDFLKAKEDVIVRTTAAYLRAARELQAGGWKNPATQAHILKYVKLDPAVLNRMGVSYIDESGALDMASIQAQEAFFRQAGQLAYSKPIDWAQFYRKDVVAKANALLAKGSTANAR